MLIRHLPYDHDAGRVAKYFQAADVYVHSALAETFPTVVLESLACGTPVITTAVGGIPEQIKGLDRKMPNAPVQGLNSFAVEDASGILVPPRDPVDMAEAILYLFANPDLCRRLGENAALEAKERFDQTEQARQYLTWYSDLQVSRGRAGHRV